MGKINKKFYLIIFLGGLFFQLSNPILNAASCSFTIPII